jgi:hypothetical protein
MEERPTDRKDPHYEETTDPANPPNAVVTPEVHKSGAAGVVGMWYYLGPLVLIVVVGLAALYFWTNTDRERRNDSSAIGTIGGDSDETTPGGFDPKPDSGSTRDEIEFRSDSSQTAAARQDRASSPSPGGALTSIGGIAEPRTVIGQRVDLKNVEVDDPVTAETFVIKDGATEMTVLAPSHAAGLKPGMKVDVAGAIESDGKGATRIRATNVTHR